MQRSLLAVMALVAAIGPAAAQTGGARVDAGCQGALELGNWRSSLSIRGYYTGSFDMTNVSSSPMLVRVTPSGPGAVIAPPWQLGIGGFTRVWAFRTDQPMTVAEIQAGVQISCIRAASR